MSRSLFWLYYPIDASDGTVVLVDDIYTHNSSDACKNTAGVVYSRDRLRERKRSKKNYTLRDFAAKLKNIRTYILTLLTMTRIALRTAETCICMIGEKLSRNISYGDSVR